MTVRHDHVLALPVQFTQELDRRLDGPFDLLLASHFLLDQRFVSNSVWLPRHASSTWLGECQARHYLAPRLLTHFSREEQPFDYATSSRSLMAAYHNPNPITLETEYRTFKVPEEVLAILRSSRKKRKMTVREFVQEAIDSELPDLLQDLKRVLPRRTGPRRPARLPLTKKLLESLRQGSDGTGVPASRLLLASIERAAQRRKKRT